MKTFFSMTSKKSSCIFLQTLGAIFEIKQRWRPFLPGYSVTLPFRQIKTFGGALAPPAPLPPTPLLTLDSNSTPNIF